MTNHSHSLIPYPAQMSRAVNPTEFRLHLIIIVNQNHIHAEVMAGQRKKLVSREKDGADVKEQEKSFWARRRAESSCISCSSRPCPFPAVFQHKPLVLSSVE